MSTSPTQTRDERRAGLLLLAAAGAALLIANGPWADIYHHALEARPKERIYTFWNYWRGAFERDAGLRIDHLLLSPKLAKRLVAAGVDRFARAMDKTSDHAPTWVELKD